jgi:hypothetical protein
MRTREFPRAGAAGLKVITRCGRQPPRRGLAPALCVLAVACGLAITACTGTPGRAAGQPAGGTAGASLTSALRQRLNAAQDPAGYLIKTTATQASPGGAAPASVTTVWTDPATGNAMMQHGTGSTRVANWERDYYQNRVLHWDSTQVDYGLRTWWTADEHAAPIKGPVPAGPPGGGYTPAVLLQEILGHATATIAGHPVVDGRRTIELSVSMPGARFDIWAASRTYQVIRTVKYFLAALRIPPITSDYSWARTSTAMAYLINHPRVPAGFTRVRIGQ